jgi:hypothetical protein
MARQLSPVATALADAEKIACAQGGVNAKGRDSENCSAGRGGPRSALR